MRHLWGNAGLSTVVKTGLESVREANPFPETHTSSLLHGSQLCSLVIFSGTNLQSQNKSGLLAITGEFFSVSDQRTLHLVKGSYCGWSAKAFVRMAQESNLHPAAERCLLHLCSTALCGRVADAKGTLTCRLTDTKNDNWPQQRHHKWDCDHAFTIAFPGRDTHKYTL